MQQPGPPRFVTVGEDVELAPRDPDPSAAYEWTIAEAPPESGADVGDGPVVHLVPDRTGTYELELSGPEGARSQRVRAYPDVRATGTFEAPVSELPDHDESDVSVVGPWNDWIVGETTPDVRGDSYVLERELPPGKHKAVFLVDENFEDGLTRWATVEGPAKPRVQLDASVSNDTIVFDASPLPAPDSDSEPGDLDVEFFVEGGDDRDALTVDGHEARYPVDEIDDSVRVHAVAVGRRHSVADAVEVDETGSVVRLNEPPSWVEDAVMYEVFVRSFVGDVGTTFDRLADRVPYLESLGVDVLWLTPILEARSPARGDDAPGGPHGYDIIDYFDVADDLGTREEFAAFVETCHDAGIRVVFDLVINHTSVEHPAFQQSAAGVEEYRDWYVWEDADDAVVPDAVSERHAGTVQSVPEHYFNWWSLPNCNYDSLAVRDHFLSVVDEWADLVDGFRCDVAWGVPHGFWKEVHDRVDSEFLLLDETVPRDPDYGEGEFDAHYDTTLYHTLRDVGSGEEPATAVLDALAASAREGFPPDSVQMRYVENHDEDRYIEECGRSALKAAAAVTLTTPGMPMIYYGQESGLREYRGDMNWATGDEQLRVYHRQLVDARAEHPSLRSERVEAVECTVETGAEDALLAYARGSGDQRVIVVVNFDDSEAVVRLSEPVESTDLVTGRSLESSTAGDDVRVPVDSVVVLPVA